MNSAKEETIQSRSYGTVVLAGRPLIFVALILSALVNVLMLTGSIYMLQIYDRVLASGSVPTLVGLFMIVVILYAFLGLYDFMRMRILSRVSLRLDQELSERAFSQSLIDRQVLSDLDLVRGSLPSPATVALLDLPFVPLFLGFLFFLHPWLGWLTVAGAAVACGIALATRLLTQHALDRAKTAEAEAGAIESGSRRAAETVLALGLIRPLAAQWRGQRDTQMAALQSGRDPADALSSFSRAFRMLLQSAILSLGAYLVITEELSAGMIIASSILSGRALTPIDQIAGHAPLLARFHAAHRRLAAALPAEDLKPAIVLPHPAGQLSVDGLIKLAPMAAGSAPHLDQPRILSNISFKLVPGDILGVIGASGSGKSTLARLLVGALATDGGTVRIDGATLDQWTATQRSTFLGYLPQRVEMLPGTIRDNIAHFAPNAPDEAVIAAAQLAGVHEIILRLPGGYGSLIGEILLSGGQMQRIALARAVYGNPAIVVLDEPNSNLDRFGEIALVKAIETLAKAGTTVVIIAHRTEALRSLTKLLILKDGQVSAFGPLQEVLATQADDPDPKSAAETGGVSHTSFSNNTSNAPMPSFAGLFQKTEANASLRPVRPYSASRKSTVDTMLRNAQSKAQP
jgi:ATP-binding cassette subfamily C exporter for protease/lipase